MQPASVVFKLNVVADDPRFEGFALEPSPSVLGRESLDDDLTPGFADAESNPYWKQPSLADRWAPPRVVGRVAEFNDYPGIDLVLPALSERAVAALRPLLEPNGELLPLKSATTTQYFFYNILTISDALDRSRSICDFWCDPPTTATQIDFFEFDRDKLRGLSIFRIREKPCSVMVTGEFVERVKICGLKGFSFTKVWPLPAGTNWRRQPSTEEGQRVAELKQHTLVLAIPLSGAVGEMHTLETFEAAIDAKLKPVSLEDVYYGSYEGRERHDAEYRMFLSCPDVDLLFEFLRSTIESLNWPTGVTVWKRFGRMYEVDAREQLVSIWGGHRG